MYNRSVERIAWSLRGSDRSNAFWFHSWPGAQRRNWSSSPVKHQPWWFRWRPICRTSEAFIVVLTRYCSYSLFLRTLSVEVHFQDRSSLERICDVSISGILKLSASIMTNWTCDLMVWLKNSDINGMGEFNHCRLGRPWDSGRAMSRPFWSQHKFQHDKPGIWFWYSNKAMIGLGREMSRSDDAISNSIKKEQRSKDVSYMSFLDEAAGAAIPWPVRSSSHHVQQPPRVASDWDWRDISHVSKRFPAKHVS